MPTHYYVIGGIRVRVNSPWSPHADPWLAFRSNVTEAIDLQLDFAPFTPKVDGLVAVDHTAYVGPETIVGEGSEAWGRWKLELRSPIDGPWRLLAAMEFDALRLRMFPYMTAVLAVGAPVLERLLVTRGVLPVHAAGFVGDDGHARLIVGRAGHRKTTMLLEAIECHAKILGDDKVLVHTATGEAAPYPVMAGIFDQLAHRGLGEDLRLIDKLALLPSLRSNKPPADYWAKGRFPVSKLCATECTMMGRDEERKSHIGIESLLANQVTEIWVSLLADIPQSIVAPLWVAQSYAHPAGGIHQYVRELRDHCSLLVLGRSISILDVHPGMTQKEIFPLLRSAELL